MNNRITLTWIILLSSFTACVLLTLSIPIGVNAFVQQSTRRLFVYARGAEGRPSTTLGGEVLLPGNAPVRYRTPIGMDAGLAERGIFEIVHPDSDILLARIDVIGSANVKVDEATMPRFTSSSAENEITLGLTEGSVQIAIPVEASNQSVYVNTPNGQAEINLPGQYTLSFADDTMQVSVYEGEAILRSSDGSDSLLLVNEERGELGTDLRTAGPFDTERNLIRNGDFSEGFNEWRIIKGRLELQDQAEPKLDIEAINGESTLRFSRDAEGNASTSVQQSINESLSLYTDMRFNITLRIINQSLDVCGFQGTECPLTVRFDFRNANGQVYQWAQGYYVKGEIGENSPDVCLTCGYPLSLSKHQRLSQANEVYTLGGDVNLIELLGNEGLRPDFIESIRIIAEGHSFAVDVINVDLLVSEDGLEISKVDEDDGS